MLIKRISGPISFREIKISNTKILLFGDQHFEEDELCNNCKSDKYCYSIFDIIDYIISNRDSIIYVELPYLSHDNIDIVPSDGFLKDIYDRYIRSNSRSNNEYNTVSDNDYKRNEDNNRYKRYEGREGYEGKEKIRSFDIRQIYSLQGHRVVKTTQSIEILIYEYCDNKMEILESIIDDLPNIFKLTIDNSHYHDLILDRYPVLRNNCNIESLNKTSLVHDSLIRLTSSSRNKVKKWFTVKYMEYYNELLVAYKNNNSDDIDFSLVKLSTIYTDIALVANILLNVNDNYDKIIVYAGEAHIDQICNFFSIDNDIRTIHKNDKLRCLRVDLNYEL